MLFSLKDINYVHLHTDKFQNQFSSTYNKNKLECSTFSSARNAKLICICKECCILLDFYFACPSGAQGSVHTLLCNTMIAVPHETDHISVETG